MLRHTLQCFIQHRFDNVIGAVGILGQLSRPFARIPPYARAMADARGGEVFAGGLMGSVLLFAQNLVKQFG